MTTPAEPSREDLREQVRRLIAQGLSNRAIARRPGMPSRDTIGRWRRDLAAPAPTGATGSAPPATPAMPPGPAGAPPVRQDPADVPVPAWRTLTVCFEGDLREDLAILTSAGLTQQAAVALAVQLLADAYRSAWDYGHYARGTRPGVRVQITGAQPTGPQ